MPVGKTSDPKLDLATCKGCGQRIAWCVMESGKRGPLDPNPVNMTVIGDDGRGRVVRGYVSHFATCPKADKFKGGGQLPREGAQA